jgi:monoamine oxidase
MNEPDVIAVGAGLAGLVPMSWSMPAVGVLIVEQENRTTGKALSVTYTAAEQCDLEESGIARRSSRSPSRGKSDTQTRRSLQRWIIWCHARCLVSTRG